VLQVQPKNHDPREYHDNERDVAADDSIGTQIGFGYEVGHG
jgi:hypothetical protein